LFAKAEEGSAVVVVVVVNVDDIEDENNKDVEDGNNPPTCGERCLLLLAIIVKHVADLDLSSNETAYARTKMLGRGSIMVRLIVFHHLPTPPSTVRKVPNTRKSLVFLAVLGAPTTVRAMVRVT
jgi:hypothetical protein